MGTQQPIRKIVMPEIPDKLYFRIGDVARLCEVPTYVLRFWETEFPQLKPNKGGTGQRLYRRRDVELALRIKSLLYDQGYTIPGARQVFKNEAAARSAEAAAPVEPAPMHATAASPAAAPLHGMPAVQPQDSGEALRRMARLRDLREAVAALLATLSQAPDRADAPAESKADPKVKAMRPRLVLEPWPKRDSAEGTGHSGGLRLQRSQRDLFTGEPAQIDEWPEPPVAS